MKFLALNVDINNSSLDPLGLSRPAQVSIKEGCPLISGYFTAISLISIKTVTYRYAQTARHAAY